LEILKKTKIRDIASAQDQSQAPIAQFTLSETTVKSAKLVLDNLSFV
jgi:hypothetical protein